MKSPDKFESFHLANEYYQQPRSITIEAREIPSQLPQLIQEGLQEIYICHLGQLSTKWAKTIQAIRYPAGIALEGGIHELSSLPDELLNEAIEQIAQVPNVHLLVQPNIYDQYPVDSQEHKRGIVAKRIETTTKEKGNRLFVVRR
jgi:hypothetical protein